MAFIPVPGVAAAIVTWHINTHKANQVWHFNGGSPATWSPANTQLLADTLFNSMKTRLAIFFAPDVTCNNVVTIDLSTSTPATGASSAAAWVGTGTSTMPPNCSIMCNLIIPLRFRGGHPRTYFPPAASQNAVSTQDTWTTTAQSNFRAAYIQCWVDAESAIPGIFPAVPTYNYTETIVGDKVHRVKSSLKQVYNVNNALVSAPIRTQRRRMTSGA
jgi:hypothetical protein